ncbi:synaptotagmin 1,2, putative [Schistosoma mansoni]|nr:synaptotagmin 1,2, putative [Schistosoma mansoni]|eukprot:XP_018644640.1 synaptotagmin 1,2, putative [Schistosoma mansoni]
MEMNEKEQAGEIEKQYLGKLQFSLDYDFQKAEVRVKICVHVISVEYIYISMHSPNNEHRIYHIPLKVKKNS